MARSLWPERPRSSLLDRLSDDAAPLDPARACGASLTDLRAAVLRDLTHLLNATRLDAARSLRAWPQVERSVLNYGLPALAGVGAAALDLRAFEQALDAAIRHHEPRIVAATLAVRAIDRDGAIGRPHVLSLEISGQIRAEPLPLELLLRTEFDLETGRVELTEPVRRGAARRG